MPHISGAQLSHGSLRLTPDDKLSFYEVLNKIMGHGRIRSSIVWTSKTQNKEQRSMSASNHNKGLGRANVHANKCCWHCVYRNTQISSGQSPG